MNHSSLPAQPQQATAREVSNTRTHSHTYSLTHSLTHSPGTSAHVTHSSSPSAPLAASREPMKWTSGISSAVKEVYVGRGRNE
jgi:hypothetical protein